ncbi:hypothetical protein WT66_13090 [Burkholderia stagnalis]|nr:hypothetical protein WT18_31935 [Burkholderia stagnalis]KVP01503.1 hypothetical protein WT20_32160 [Burkholderia stagnalis]KVW93538.1 hypothetical protein WT30_19700 [Burkholderia stagnalis]KWH79370.1 hypothetical protein WT66_13090 [Burkholderia stagnalis]
MLHEIVVALVVAVVKAVLIEQSRIAFFVVRTVPLAGRLTHQAAQLLAHLIVTLHISREYVRLVLFRCFPFHRWHFVWGGIVQYFLQRIDIAHSIAAERRVALTDFLPAH